VEYVTTHSYHFTEHEIHFKRGGVIKFFIHLFDATNNSCEINCNFD